MGLLNNFDPIFWELSLDKSATGRGFDSVNPNAPEQNPVEDIWLYAKRFVREFYHLFRSFAAVKRLFELVIHH